MKNWQEFSEKIIEVAKEEVWKSNFSIEYLKQRLVTEDQVKKYELGSLSKEQLASLVSGLTSEVRESDRFREFFARWSGVKVIWPIRNPLGHLLAVEYRTIGPHEYFRDPLERAAFCEVFFGLPQQIERIWKKKEVFICEGAFDALAFELVFPQVSVLAAHTQTLVASQVRFLKRFVSKVSLMFDKTAIQQMTDFRKRYSSDFAIGFLDWRKRCGLDLSGIKDINELVKQAGVFKARRFLQEQFVELE